MIFLEIGNVQLLTPMVSCQENIIAGFSKECNVVILSICNYSAWNAENFNHVTLLQHKNLLFNCSEETFVPRVRLELNGSNMSY